MKTPTITELRQFVQSSPPRNVPSDIRERALKVFCVPKEVIGIGIGLCAIGIVGTAGILLKPLFSDTSAAGGINLPMLLLVLSFPIVGFFLAFPNWKRRQKTVHLLENGRAVEGTVIDVVRARGRSGVGSSRRPKSKIRKHVILAAVDTQQGQRAEISFVVYKRTGAKLARLAMEQGTPLVFLFDENDPETAIPPVMMLANSVIRPALDAGTLQDVTLRT